MQTMLHHGPYTLAKVRAKARNSVGLSELVQRFSTLDDAQLRRFLHLAGQQLTDRYEVILKVLLVGSVLFGFFQLITFLLTWSDSLLVQIPALALWACGAIPLLYRLWWLDLSGERATLTPYADYSEKMLVRELLPTRQEKMLF